MWVAGHGGRAWWVAPSYPMSQVGWRLIRNLGVQYPGTEIKQSERLITLPTSGTIQVRSADNYDSLRGDGLDLVVIDECAFVKEEAWTEALRPALSERQGGAFFISTPKGRNWFWRLWQRCLDPSQPDWQGWQLPTSENPYIAPEEVEAARQLLPARIFEQEYLAQFLDEAGGVFHRIMECALAPELPGPQPNRSYIAGVDIANEADFTVVSILDAESREQVAIDRFNRIGYVALEERIVALSQRWNLQTLIVENNSVGQPVIDRLQLRGLPVIPFHTSAVSKTPLIQSLQSAFEHDAIRILLDPVQVSELQAYESSRLASGVMRFSAPAGMHDDTVMALALAWYGVAGMTPAFL